MKEININIEGYNVNGICVGCLNYNRKMFYKSEVKDCFKLLADIDVPEDLAIQVCWECLAAVRAMYRFQAQILKSYEVLIDYSHKHTFLNSPSDLTKYACQRLTSSGSTQPPVVETRHPCADGTQDIELEIEYKSDDLKSEEFENEIKSENDIEESLNAGYDSEPVKDEAEFSQDTRYSEGVSQDLAVTSDEDIQLSKLKKKKKKGRKSKRERKKSFEKSKPKECMEEQPRSVRKLKNLPEDLVELYTMSEEEMWRVRSEDLQSKEFVKLKYKCQDCIIGFNTEKLMNDHMSGKHRPKGEECRRCDVCKAYFLTKDNVAVHRALHLTAFRCRECALCTGLKRVMARHARAHAGPGEESHHCSTCDRCFSTKSKLTYHRTVCHQEKPQCDCCGKVFANKMTLKYHLKLLPQNKEDKPKEKLYIPCKGCNKVFHSKKSYRAHVVIHDGVTYPCPTCGKLFQWKRNLARHARNHRERDAGALHECRECGKTFSSRDCYNNHMRLSKRHVPEDAYGHECNYCGKKFATKWCMVDHIDWDHLNRIKYQCNVCFKAFKTAKIMVAHVNNIHGGRRHREPDGEHLCDICGKSYKTVKRLKGHVWAMHTNRSTSKSFKCKLCPATFTWQTSIYKHNKMMHDNKRSKQPRALPPPSLKKQDPYPEAGGGGGGGAGAELARMHYFQHNIASSLAQNMGHALPTQIAIAQNIV